MKIIAVYNIKGGVGKTATAVNLAYLSAEAGIRTLLWDLDPQASASYYFRVHARVDASLKKMVRGKRPLADLVRGTDYEGLDLVPADFSYRHLDLVLEAAGKPRRRLRRILAPLARRYDHVFLDCAPSISLVSEGVFGAADALLVPTIPTTLSLRTLDQLGTVLDDHGLDRSRVMPFFCMVDRRKSLHREIAGSIEHAGFEFLRAVIPYSSIVERMGVQRSPVSVFGRGTDVDRAYRALWTESLSRIGSWLGWALK